MAADNADAVAVTAAYRWGTAIMVFANGAAVITYWGSGHGHTPGQYDERSGNYLSQSGNSYKVTVCFRHILLRRPCAAGGYHRSTLATYAEASTANCSCPAGMFWNTAGASRVCLLSVCVLSVF